MWGRECLPSSGCSFLFKTNDIKQNSTLQKFVVNIIIYPHLTPLGNAIRGSARRAMQWMWTPSLVIYVCRERKHEVSVNPTYIRGRDSILIPVTDKVPTFFPSLLGFLLLFFLSLTYFLIFMQLKVCELWNSSLTELFFQYCARVLYVYRMYTNSVLWFCYC